MPKERTLSIIKPDATKRKLADTINARLQAAGLKIVAKKRMTLTLPQAERFYAVHKARPFFASLCRFMVAGEVVVQVLEGDNAIARYREVMGATDPAKAAAGTLRKDFGTSIEANAVHGSDSPETARFEIGHFFSPAELGG